jgi:hypothetical protein
MVCVGDERKSERKSEEKVWWKSGVINMIFKQLENPYISLFSIPKDTKFKSAFHFCERAS